jgi:hypothetical protein
VFLRALCELKIATSPNIAEASKLVCNNTHVPQSDTGKGSPLFYMGLTIAPFINPFRKLIVIITTSNRTNKIKTKGRRNKILTWKNLSNKKGRKITDANRQNFTIKGSDNSRVKQFCLIYFVSSLPPCKFMFLPFSLHLALHPFPFSHVLDVKKNTSPCESYASSLDPTIA